MRAIRLGERRRRDRLETEDPYGADDRAANGRRQVELVDGDPAPATRPWAVSLLVGLYAEAHSKGIGGFLVTTSWVLKQAAERVGPGAIADAPLPLLRGLYDYVARPDPMRLLWRHRGAPFVDPARRTIKP
jgi:hypothetical protein